MRKILTVFMACLITLTSTLAMTGCNRDKGEAFDATKSHLYVGLYNAGLGVDWLYDVKDRFEEFYKDESFEEGKTGIQIHISDIEAGGPFLSKIATATQEVVFSAGTDYYAFVNEGKVLDISSAVTTIPTEYGETKSIYDRMSNDEREFYKAEDGKYYGVPYSNIENYIVMNVDLFEKKSLYFAKGGCPSEYLRTNPACDPALEGEWDDSMWSFTGKGEKSAGPDGKYGTWDDGEPATYEEFYAFCENCSDNTIQAFTWAGKYPNAISNAMIPMLVDYEGYEQMKLNYTFDGIAKDLISVSSDGTVTKKESVKITGENGYELYSQAGRYYVLDFIYKLLKNKNFYDENVNIYNLNHTHIEAQEDFISGGIISGAKETALLWDGEWWLNEAEPAFKVLAESKGAQYGITNRKFKMMSIPKATNEKVGEPYTKHVISSSVCMLNANIAQKKIDWALKFIKFAFTNESNLKFVEHTNTVRSYELDYDEGYLDNLGYFTKSLIEREESAVKLMQGDNNKMYVNKSGDFFTPAIVWLSNIDGTEYEYPTYAYTKSGINAIKYFNGVQTAHNKTYWKNNYNGLY